MWTCPNCSRQFRNPGQWHSCVVRSVEAHLEGKPETILAIFQRLDDFLQSLDGVRVDPVKGSINYARRANFVIVNLGKSFVDVTFSTVTVINSPRMKQTFQPVANHALNVIRLKSVAEVDNELLGWLHEAWELSAPPE